MYEYEYDKVVAKLKAGEKLTEQDMCTLVYDGYEIDEVDGYRNSWTESITTILDIDGELWAIDWDRGLVDTQANKFDRQPYRVRTVERTAITTDYVALEG